MEGIIFLGLLQHTTPLSQLSSELKNFFFFNIQRKAVALSLKTIEKNIKTNTDVKAKS